MEHAQNGDFKPEKSRNPEARGGWSRSRELPRIGHYRLQRVARRVEEIICFRVSWRRPIVFQGATKLLVFRAVTR